jgi:hypothetical protein
MEAKKQVQSFNTECSLPVTTNVDGKNQTKQSLRQILEKETQATFK